MKENIIKEILKERLKVSKSLKELENDLNYYRSLPNAILGVEIDGIKNENPDFKNDGLENISHQIGYLTSLKYELEYVMALLDMDEEGLNKHIEENEKIDKENTEYINNIFNEIKHKLS